MTAIDLANAEQRAASNPAVSAFVAASAGSGKTKLLTDRLLRLMLGGTAPDKILCLTYTKAAAAEMRIRLNRRLGEWVVMEEPALRAELAGIGVAATETTLRLARALFAVVLDLPGGMRIETIHAFCQSLLRRFPLEAELSPHFEVADDEIAAEALREAREAVLADMAARQPVAALAAETNEQDFIALTAKFAAEAPEGMTARTPAQLAALIRAAVGAGEETEADRLATAVAVPGEIALRNALLNIADSGNDSGKKWVLPLLDWLGLYPEDRAARWQDWVDGLLTSGGAPRTLRGYCGKALKAEEDGIKALVWKEAERIIGIQDRVRAARLAALNAELIKLLLPIEAASRRTNNLAARLSYDGLVNRTGQLLVDPGAAWVLYKLDGGIEHLLLDEVQDTAPAQWSIANAIAAEFFAGAGAREARRSIFAVGDPKQSIFSFQGADLRSFETNREKFRNQAQGAGQKWLDGQLSVSFRSTAPVLALTDAVFAQGFARQGVCNPGEELRHGVSRAGQAGRVTLWPLAKAPDLAEAPRWNAPDEYESAASAREILARAIADYVARRLQSPLPSRGRKARPGDFLILVRRRNALVGAMSAALKARGIEVAGADRMVLTNQPAVGDLLALCEALLLPDDDLAFGQYLASPLGGLSDESLMALALGRQGRLVAALYARGDERADWRAAKAFFEALRAKADFLSPYALLAEALGPLGGRAKLLLRLGAEAMEAIDEFLAEALQFTISEPGALQNFVRRARLSGASIKRESESGGNAVRIMTAHGAKGLQAPIVILPDTTGVPDSDGQLFWLEAEGESVPVFCPRAALRARPVTDAAAAAAAAAMEEYNRLLYVALTRAEDELLICGTEGKRKPPETCWYEAVKAGFARLPARAGDDALVYDCEQEAPPDRQDSAVAAAIAPLPAWVGRAPGWVPLPPSLEATRPERIAPSRGVEDEVKRAIAASPLGSELAEGRARRAAAMERGNAVHALLQHLPDLPPAARADAALRYVAAQPALAPVAGEVVESVLQILQMPALAPLFGPHGRAEAPLAGVVGDVEIGGLVDRLAVTETEILLADYKTDRVPPTEVSGIPPKYISQLAAYRAIMRQIRPALPVRCVLVWTQNATPMEVPPVLLDAAAPA